MKVWIVSYDSERKRDLFWIAHLGRFSYYEEAGTVFDSEEHAQIYARYANVKYLKFRPVHNGEPERG